MRCRDMAGVLWFRYQIHGEEGQHGNQQHSILYKRMEEEHSNSKIRVLRDTKGVRKGVNKVILVSVNITHFREQSTKMLIFEVCLRVHGVVAILFT